MTQPQSTRQLADRILSEDWSLNGLTAFLDDYMAVREEKIIREALTAAKRGFNSKSKKSRKNCVYERIRGLATAGKQFKPERMQPAGEANERNFGVKLERQGGE